MTFDFSSTKGKLTDPVLMEWALNRLHDTQGGALSQQLPPPVSWLDAATLRYWLESDDEEIIDRLFFNLPAECFAGQAETIAEHWPQWRGRSAERAAVVLAQIAPVLAWTCFTQPPEGSHWDTEAQLGIIQALPLLPPDKGRALLGVLAQDAAALNDDQWRSHSVLDSLFRFGLPVDPEPLLPLLRSCFADDLEPSALNGHLKAIDAALFGDHSYRELAADIREDRTQQTFASLARLFRDEAPLEQLDRWCHAPIDPSEPMDLAERLAPEGTRAVLAAVLEPLSARPLDASATSVADFCIGAIAATHARDDIGAATLTLSAVIDVLAADVSPPRHFDALLARLRDFDRAQVTAELIAALEREALTYGGVTLARVMGHLGWQDFIPTLVEALTKVDGDLLKSETEWALARIGEPAGLALLERWDALDGSQRLFAIGAISTMGGEPAVRLVLEHEEDVMAEATEFWSGLVESAPDPRLLAHIEPMLRRRQDWIDRPFYVLGRLLGSEHPELEAAGERARAHRQAQSSRINAIMRGTDWSAESLTMKLQCPECGDLNLYDVRRLAVDSADAQEHMVIAQELACASCGRYTDLAITPDARLAVLGELLRLGVMLHTKTPQKSQVLVRILGMRHGRKRPVGELLAVSEAAVDKDPSQVGEWLRLAHDYQKLLGRPRFAARFREQALKREPHAVEGVLLEVNALIQEGEDARAMELLDQALAAKDRWRYFVTDIQDPSGVARDFSRLYSQLSQKLERTDRPMPTASELALPKKVGRNDPCPCGSGKKYKKCCLARS